MKLKKWLLSLSSFIVIALLINISYSEKPVYAGNNPDTKISANSVESEQEPDVLTEDDTNQPTEKPAATNNKPAENTSKPADTNANPATKNNAIQNNKTTSIPGYVPSSTYKPIIGKRVVYSHQAETASKKNLYKKVCQKKKEIDTVDLDISRKEKYLNSIQSLLDKTKQKGSTLFVKKEESSDILNRISKYDQDFEPYKTYSLVTGAEGLLEACQTFSLSDNTSDVNKNKQVDELQTDNQLFSNDLFFNNNSIHILKYMNVDAIDIGEYLDVNYEKQNEYMHKLYEKKEVKLKELEKVDKKYRAVSIGDVVFNPKDVTEVSNINLKQMTYILKGTNLEQYAPTYIQIEKDYGINAIAICSLSAHESNWGRSRRAIEDHNYTGFGVYSDSSVGINTSTGEENLLMTAKHLAKNYVVPGAKYYNGKGLDGINRKYAASRTWAFGIEQIGYRLMDKLKTYK